MGSVSVKREFCPNLSMNQGVESGVLGFAATFSLAYSPAPFRPTEVPPMALRERFTEAMKAAMKARETKRVGTVRLMMAEVQKHGIATRNENPTDEEILGLLGKMIKQREESAAIYDSGGRPELAAGEREEITIIREFMPRQLSPEEMRTAVQEAIAATAASSLKDMGKVMAALKQRHTGSMDFAKAGAAVKELLATPKA
jgi:hypothetical protein